MRDADRKVGKRMTTGDGSRADRRENLSACRHRAGRACSIPSSTPHPLRSARNCDRVREILGDVRNTSLESVTTTLEKAYEVELRKRVETDILRPYGMGRDQFVQKGRECPGDLRFNFVMDQVAAVDPGIELLVGGLDGFGELQLFTVSLMGSSLQLSCHTRHWERCANGAGLLLPA